MGESAMREAITPLVVGLLSATATSLCAAQASGTAQVPDAAHASVAAEAPAKSDSAMPQMVVLPTVHLNGAADLEHLRETNLYHYLRAKKILAAANEICRPRVKQTYLARFDGADPHCGSMWMTSFPPKKQLSFHLDSVYYIALVTVTANIGKLVQIH